MGASRASPPPSASRTAPAWWRPRCPTRAPCSDPAPFAKADIVLAGDLRVVTVPATAIVTFAGVEKVLTVDKGRAVEVRVTTGRRLGDRVEIVTGIKAAGTPVVGQPGSLTEGQPVTVSPSHAELAEVCIRRPVFAAMLVLSLVVVGAASYARLGVDRFPAVDVPTVSVRTELGGASAEEVESQVTREIEQVVNTVQGIRELRSISGPSQSIVIVEFELRRNIDVAAQDVREKVALAIRNLPRDVKAPIIAKFDNDQAPALTVAVAGDRPLRELTELADKVVKIAGALVRRGRGAARGRPQPRDQRVGGGGSARRLPAAHHRGSRRPRPPERGHAGRQCHRGAPRVLAPHHRAPTRRPSTTWSSPPSMAPPSGYATWAGRRTGPPSSARWPASTACRA